MAGHTGRGNETGVVCARSGDGTTGPSAKPCDPPGCRYRGTSCHQLIYTTRALQCTQSRAGDSIRTLTQCQQPGHGPTSEARLVRHCAGSDRPYLLFPATTWQPARADTCLPGAPRHPRDSAGARRFAARPLAAATAPGTGPAEVRGWCSCPFKKRVRARTLLSCIFRPGSCSSSAHAHSEQTTNLQAWGG